MTSRCEPPPGTPVGTVDRQEMIAIMCEAYCRTSASGGGRHRYATAMERILSAIEAAGWRFVRVANGGKDG